MILNNVTLHNFMSYADAQLDLTSVEVACFAGLNGAGKSAILDAITWALWEQARSGSDELIRLGEQEMWVEVCFTLEGRTYRVKRSRQKTQGKSGGKGASKGTLDLQIEGSDGWRSLSAQSMRETENQIFELLRMDYDTFVNSVYLRQGRADEFTTRLPSERKQILGDILGLSYFDRLQELAREKVKELKSRSEILESSLMALPELETLLAQLQREVAESESNARQASDKFAFYEDTFTRLQNRLKELNLAGERLDAGRVRQAELQADLSVARQREGELGEKLATLSALVDRSAEIETAANEFNQLRAQVEQLDQNALTNQDLGTRRLELQSELASMRSRLEVQLEHQQGSLSELAARQKQLTKESAETEKLASSYRQFKEMVAKESELAIRQEAFTKLTSRSDQLYSLIQEAKIRLEAEVQQKEANCAELEQLLDSASTVDEEKKLIEDEVAALDKLEAEFELVEQSGLKVKSDLEAVAMQIDDRKRRQNENNTKIAELEERADSSICPLCSAPIVDRLAVINRYKQQNAAIDREISELTDSQGRLETERSSLRKKYTELRTRLDGRKNLDKQIGQFNEKLASIERARDAASDVRNQLARLKVRLEKQDYAQVERESLISVKAEIHKLDFDPVIYANLQAQIRMQRHIEGRHQQMLRDNAELKKVEQELPKLKEQLEELRDKLTSGKLGSELSAELEKVNKEIEKLAYDRLQHQELRQKLTELIPVRELMRDLMQARQDKPVVEAAHLMCSAALSLKSEQLEKLTSDIALWQEALGEAPELESQRRELEPLLAQWRSTRETLSTEVAVLTSRVEQLNSERSKLLEQRKELESTRADRDDYQLLADAFGKKGIQAVIIENAIPEIEAEANRILSRLSENQMHVALVTQYKTKSGGTVETLDLLIGDEVGTRNYELYSGGEAFKINFSVRVALSRLLARRAGARLETLIIDEGFGSQDETSRERLVRVIGSIQRDFARILVITHIAEVKELFPTHIYVSKQNGASQIQIM